MGIGCCGTDERRDDEFLQGMEIYLIWLYENKKRD